MDIGPLKDIEKAASDYLIRKLYADNSEWRNEATIKFLADETSHTRVSYNNWLIHS